MVKGCVVLLELVGRRQEYKMNKMNQIVQVHIKGNPDRKYTQRQLVAYTCTYHEGVVSHVIRLLLGEIHGCRGR